MSKFILTQGYIDSVDVLPASKFESRICCPVCLDEGYHLYFNSRTHLYHCFKCGLSGKIKEEREVVTDDAEKYMEAYLKLKQSYSDKITENKLIEKKEVKNLPFNEKIIPDLLNGPIPLVNDAFNYLRKRGMTLSEIYYYDVRYSTEQGKFKHCVIFPFADEQRKLVYFVARRITNKEPRYINAPWSKKGLVWIPDLNEVKSPEALVLVEGIFDALTLNRNGFLTGCLFGKKPSAEQMFLIAKYAIGNRIKKIIICIDGDAFSQAVIMKLELYHLLREHSNIRLGIHLIIGSDPDSAIKENPSEFVGQLNETIKST